MEMKVRTRATVLEPAALSRPLAEQRATYVACVRGAGRGRGDARGGELDLAHPRRWPMVSAPDELVALLAQVASEQKE